MTPDQLRKSVSLGMLAGCYFALIVMNSELLDELARVKIRNAHLSVLGKSLADELAIARLRLEARRGARSGPVLNEGALRTRLGKDLP